MLVFPVGLHSSSASGLSLDFTVGALPSGATFTRASSGTRYNSSGLLVTETTDAPRFDYDPNSHASLGILIEPAATNLALRSEEFDDAVWAPTSVTVTANAAVAPTGATTADKITPSPGTGYKPLAQDSIVTSSGQTYTFSVRAKPAGFNYLLLYDFTAEKGRVFSLLDGSNSAMADGSASTSYGSRQIASGYWLIWVTHAAANSSTHLRLYALDDASGDSQVAGDGSSGVYGFGIQVELGSVATSYIKTTTAAAARAADALSFTIPAATATLRYTFDDGSLQDVAVSPGAYTVPTNLNRPRIKTIVGL